jgi:predicted lipid-binding transport protein (Tim44 family)
MPQRSGWMSGLMGGIAGLALGGLIGSMLFGGLGGGLFGGLGLLEMLLIGGLLYFAFVYMRRRLQPTPASPYGYGPPQGIDGPSWQSETRAVSTATIDVIESDLERGLRHIRQLDSTFDPERFATTAAEAFCTVQTAWAARDMGAARDLMTPDLYETMQKEGDRLRAERRMNRLEHMTVRAVQVTEAWQETGQDFVTVHVLASLLDYTVDEINHQVVAGSRTEPVQCEEYWTFVRPVGPNPWKLSAIQQAE